MKWRETFLHVIKMRRTLGESSTAKELKLQSIGAGFPRSDINPFRNKAITPEQIYDFFVCQRTEGFSTFVAYFFRDHFAFCKRVSIV